MHSNENGLHSIAEDSMPNNQVELSPVIIFGAGMTRQVVGEDLSKQVSRKVAPLLQWKLLLKEVAIKEHLCSRYHPQLAEKMPTVQWDELVRLKASLTNQACHHAEAELRKVIAKVIKESSDLPVNKHKCSQLLNASGKHIISLNFDTLPLTYVKTIYSDNSKPMPFCQIDCDDDKPLRTFWFPHGCHVKPDSIKLGIRDYGFLPSVWDKTFKHYKAYERLIKPGSKLSAIAYTDYLEIIDKIKRTEDPYSSFLGHLFLAPLVFFGTSLHESEWGLWWVINQRARNFARIPADRHPPVIIFLSSRETDRDLLWAARPANIVPIYADDWDTGWDEFIKLLGTFSTCQGEVMK